MIDLKVVCFYLIWVIALTALTPTSIYGADATLDWKKLEGEAATLLSRYIQVDTTDPPGNEINGAVLKGSLRPRRD
jgi:hypothetical protein